MNKVLLLLAAAAALIVLVFIFVQQPATQMWQAPSPSSTYVVGNQTPYAADANPEAHGCSASAGYSWCKDKGKCIETAKEKCEPVIKASTVLFMSAEVCANAGGTVAEGQCPSGLSQAAEVYNDGSAKKVCCTLPT